MLSRRRLITVGVAVGATSLLSPTHIQAAASDSQSTANVPDVSQFLRITAPTDSGFQSTLDKLFPGLSKHPTFHKIRSHSVLITNVSSKPLMGYSTHWVATTPTGGYETTIRHYFHPNRKHKHNHSSRFGSMAKGLGLQARYPRLGPVLRDL